VHLRNEVAGMACWDVSPRRNLPGTLVAAERGRQFDPHFRDRPGSDRRTLLTRCGIPAARRFSAGAPGTATTIVAISISVATILTAVATVLTPGGTTSARLVSGVDVGICEHIGDDLGLRHSLECPVGHADEQIGPDVVYRAAIAGALARPGHHVDAFGGRRNTVQRLLVAA
jgi:hypothetical protein